jgi:membrane protease YdiL (CAAX protease family)
MSEPTESELPKYPEGIRYSPVVFTATSLVIVFILYQFVGGGITLLIAGGSITADSVMLARGATMAAQFLFLLIPTLWLVKRQHGALSAALSFRMPSSSEIVLSILGMVALLQAAEGYIYFQGKIPLPESIVPYVEQIKKMIEETYRVLVEARSVPELIFVIIVVSVTPAICEEVLFRGLVQKNFSLALNAKRGVVVTGIIFGLYHFNPFHAVPLIALGMYFSFLQYRSRTLIIPMIAHFVNNAISVIAAYVYGYSSSDIPTLMQDEAEKINDGTVAMTTLLFLVIFGIVIKMYLRSTDHRVHDAAPAEHEKAESV